MRRILLFGAVLACAYQGSLAQAQNEEIVEGEVFITFREGATESKKNEVLNKYDLKLIKFYEIFGFGLYQTKLGTLDVIEKLKMEPSVIQVGPNHFRSANSVPNDPYFGSQWYLPKINWPDAWAEFNGTEQVTVAVVDSGVSKTHLQLNTALTSFGEHDYYDNDNNAEDGYGHGTMVAGIIAAKINDGAGVTGICPMAKILPLRVFDNTGKFPQVTSDALVSAMQQAIIRGVKVVNLSLGSTGYNVNEWIAIYICSQYGVLVVCAAGNGGSDVTGDNNDLLPTYPASYNLDNILSVAATDETDNLASFSNYGSSSVHLAAPGQHILGCDVSRQVLCNWTFDYGYEGWTPYRTSGYGWGRSLTFASYLGDYGITTNDWSGLFSGNYQAGSNMDLISPIIDLSGKKSCRLEVWLGGQLGLDDYLTVYTSYADLTHVDFYDFLAFPGWNYQKVERDISDLDGKIGRAIVELRADLLGLGIFSSGIIGIQGIRVTALNQGGSAENATRFNDGTSFSAPMVSGVAAMLFSQNPNLTYSEVRQIILDKTRKVAALNGKVSSGGVLDAAAALREAKARVVVSPAITSSTSASGTVGSSFSYSITASGTPTSYNASSLPSGLSVNTSTGVISGTPSSAGTFTSSISASNTAGSGSTSLRITIAKAIPAITSSPTASAITYGQTLASSTLSGGSASVAGNFAWTTPSTAPAVGTSVQNVTFTPTDSVNYNTATTSVSVTVNKTTPVINTVPTASAITFGQTLASSTLTGGSANVAGNFAWTTPSTTPAVGTSVQNVTFTPTDSVNYNTATTSVSVTANQTPTPPPTALVITSDLAAVSINLGASFSHQITASGSPTSFGAIRLPTGLKLNASTGLISGKPTKVGVFSATLQALKKGSTTATATKVFTVVQVPTFTYAPTINAKKGKALKVAPTIAGYPAPSFSILSGSLPPGLSLNASTAAITGTPTAIGTYPFTVRGSNSVGNTDRSTTIVVK